MSVEITTISFYILCLVTITLQAIMWHKRSRFLKAINEKGPQGSRFADLENILRTVVPIKLNKVDNEEAEQLRTSAAKASNYWLVSLLLTLLLSPILLSLAK